MGKSRHAVCTVMGQLQPSDGTDNSRSQDWRVLFGGLLRGIYVFMYHGFVLMRIMVNLAGLISHGRS